MVDYFRKQLFTDTLDTGLYEFVQWLTNEHATETGPGFTVVEAYDGTNRDTPSGGTGLANLPGTNGWQSGPTITSDGSWIVLESLDSNNTNHFQIYIEREDSDTIHFLLIPLEDFATGGGAVSPPTFPATALGAGAGAVVVFDLAQATNTWYGVADEGMFFLLVDTGGVSGMDWIYAGECDESMLVTSDPDDRNYVIWDNPGTWLDSGGATAGFNRLSPLDDATVLVAGHPTLWSTDDSNAYWTEAGFSDNVLGEEPIIPIFVWYEDAGHQHLQGALRNVYSGGTWLAARETLSSRAYAVFKDFPLHQDCACVIGWDGATDVP